MNKIFFLITVFGLLFSACKKPVKADFSTDKDVYLAGETVKLTNISGDAISYKWTMPNGQSLTTMNPEYKLAANLDDATITFKLETFSKNGKKSSICLKSVTVKASGQAAIWTTGYGGVQRNIYVDNIFIGSFTTQYDSILHNYPPGHLTGRFSVGHHQIIITTNNFVPDTVGMYISKGDSLYIMI
ncbi:MAG: PKD domain-containing protein [Bacteroidetes bacterium]|nr:PKD domain-containing protein [Bacteroidota bacterium]